MTKKLTNKEAIEIYNEMLDEVYGEIKIGYGTYYPSDILKELDPIAYRVGFDDYMSYLSEEYGEYVCDFSVE